MSMGVFKKAFSATFAVIAAAALSLTLCYTIISKVVSGPDLENRPTVSVTGMSREQRASHMISYLDEDGKEKALCTATAIGPHALLTASHCNDGIRSKASTAIKIDYSAHHYSILAVTSDDRDHDIYLIDGPAFRYTVPLVQGVPKPDDSVRFYGFGEGVYPSTERDGKIFADEDPSDVDHAVQFFLFKIPVYHGDSGSAIYNQQGQVIGVVSYLVVWYGSEKMGAYALNFSPDRIETAQKFDPRDRTTYPQ